jgi:F-box and leucine-rich repeat protein 1 (S-phase kinase-associated protein 2)
MRLDDGCNNNLNNASVKERERWSCSGDTSLVEPEILEDMGVSMLADGEASRESLQTLKTQECTISPKNFESGRHSKNKNAIYEAKETFKSKSFEPTNGDR